MADLHIDHLNNAKPARALGSGLIDPEDHYCCDGYCGHEGVGAPVVTRGDAPPVLEAGEEVLDLVATSVDSRIVGDRDFSAAA